MLNLLLWVLLIMFILSNLGRVIMIADGTYSKPRTLSVTLADVVLNGIFTIWIAFVLGDLP